MAPKNPAVLEKKGSYIQKLTNLLLSCPKALLVSVNNVGSNQMQQIRTALRGKATIVMGKNTMMRYVLKSIGEENPQINVTDLSKVINGNIGFIFCHSAVDEIKDMVLSFKVPAAAKAGTIAPIDVSISAGPTGMEPSATSFFQALNIATKIVKGKIEIVSDVHLIKKGHKVAMSEQVLLQKLSMKPFSYSMKMEYILDNWSVFSAAVLDIKDHDIISKIGRGLRNVAALSREVGMPNEVSMPHSIVSAFRNAVALCLDLDYDFPEMDQIRAYLADPSAFVVVDSAVSTSNAASAPVAAAPEVEEEEEDAAFDLFD